MKHNAEALINGNLRHIGGFFNEYNDVDTNAIYDVNFILPDIIKQNRFNKGELKSGLIELLEDKADLEHSGIRYNSEIGFNAPSIQGDDAQIAKKNRESYLWLTSSLKGGYLRVQLLDGLAKKLGQEGSFKFATNILDLTAQFLEDPKSYSITIDQFE